MNGNKARDTIISRATRRVSPENLKLRNPGQPYDEVLLTTDTQYKHNKAKEDRIILKDSIRFRKNYRETGSVNYYQVLIPKQLVDQVFGNLHIELGRPPGDSKTLFA